MVEKFTVVEGVTVSYSGLFKYRDLLKEIHELLKKKGYDKEEKKQEEKVTSKGKRVRMEMEYSKEPSKYMKYILEIKIAILDLKDVVVTKGTRKIKYNEGDVEVKLKSYLKTDYEGRWKSKPMYVFVRHVINKYLYTFYLSKESSELKSDTKHLKETIKGFLNLYKF